MPMGRRLRGLMLLPGGAIAGKGVEVVMLIF
jgi:hypothetical protein